MTTKAAAAHYLARHQHELEGRAVAIHNPHDRPVDELPCIYAWNNGGSAGWYNGELMADDGTSLGAHVCSAEGYMLHDLGVLEGCRPDRHETFRAHYPDGYRMVWVPSSEVRTHPGLSLAYQRNQERAKAAESKGCEE